jgi:transcriptional regulator with XRE-family HTH domain
MKVVKKKTVARRKPTSAREPLKELGAKIRARRLARGMTQEDLARALSISVAYLSLIERGGRNPPFTTVVAIARALKAAPRDIVGS